MTSLYTITLRRASKVPARGTALPAPATPSAEVARLWQIAWMFRGLIASIALVIVIIGCRATSTAPVDPIFPTPASVPSNGPQIDDAIGKVDEAVRSAEKTVEETSNVSQENFVQSKNNALDSAKQTHQKTLAIYTPLFEARSIDRESQRRADELADTLVRERTERVTERAAATTQMASLRSTIDDLSKENGELKDAHGKWAARGYHGLGALFFTAGLLTVIFSSQKKLGLCLLAGGVFTSSFGLLMAYYPRPCAIGGGVTAILTIVGALALLWRQSNKNKDEAQLNETAATEIIQAIQQAKRYKKIDWNEDLKKAFEDILGNRAVELVKKETK